MYSRILVPIDTTYSNSGWLKTPLQIAWDFAQKSGGEIHLLSVIPDNLLKGYYPDIYSESVAHDVKDRLQAIAKELLPANAKVQLGVATGGICHGILRVAREINASEIVIASHGPILKDYLLGSNAAYIALHAPCSVFVVRPAVP
jgi:nucleotide-binding universal stress UspA family protein